MAATMCVGSDLYAMVVTEVISPKKIRVADMMDADYATLNENDKNVQMLSKDQMKKYVHVTDTSIIPIGDVYSYRKNKRWVAEGHGLWETISLLVNLYDSTADDCLFIDEPELHLHPQFQTFFMNEIRKEVSHSQRRMFFLLCL